LWYSTRRCFIAVFFAIYVDSVIAKVLSLSVGCVVRFVNVSILLYADDIMLIAPSVTVLQQLLNACEMELIYLDMAINVKKSACLRVGPRYNAECVTISTSDGQRLQWVDCIRYLGVEIRAARKFTCCVKRAKARFYRAFNSVFGRIGRNAPEDVIVELLKTKCLPILLNATEACPVSTSNVGELQFAVTGALMKIFNTRLNYVADTCGEMFGICSVSSLLQARTSKFLEKLCSDNSFYNFICLTAD
jgi:Reverse transcriptase (RNA-dependent DNA polymerase)